MIRETNFNHGIYLHTWGSLACFTRPEMKVERFSYDLITPSAARGLLEAIYWKPQFRWIVREIHLLAPIRFLSVRRNELAPSKIAEKTVKSAMKGEPVSLGIDIMERDDRGKLKFRQQRASVLLRDVAYIIHAEVEVLDPTERNGKKLDHPEGKHLDCFKRRAREGQYRHHPYFGCREFPAHFRLIENPTQWPERSPELTTSDLNKHLGIMLNDFEYREIKERKSKETFIESHWGRRIRATARLFRAELADGVLRVPPLQESFA